MFLVASLFMSVCLSVCLSLRTTIAFITAPYQQKKATIAKLGVTVCTPKVCDQAESYPANSQRANTLPSQLPLLYAWQDNAKWLRVELYRRVVMRCEY